MEMNFFLICAFFACAVTIYAAIELILGMKKMVTLGSVELFSGNDLPRISVIVPACNEEHNIENGLLSLLSQQYDNLEIIVVNDRSTDTTGDILNRMKNSYPQLIVHTVSDLPEGWMGKSNALAVGASIATGDYLLFTDADCMMEETTVSRAVQYMTTRCTDHLSLIFKNCSHNWLLDSLISDAGAGLFLLFKPWRVREKNRRFFVGVGAFNLVKASVYRAVAGHQKIRMHPVDDMMLAKIIKKCGYSQECLLGGDYVQVPWYDSVPAMIDGLMKNMFAVVHYRLLLVPFVLAGVIVVSVYPLWGIVFGSGYILFFCSLALAVRTIIFSAGIKYLRLPAWYVVGSLFSPYIILYTIAKAALTTFINGGIEWRGTVYTLAEMKKSEPFIF